MKCIIQSVYAIPDLEWFRKNYEEEDIETIEDVHELLLDMGLWEIDTAFPNVQYDVRIEE